MDDVTREVEPARAALETAAKRLDEAGGFVVHAEIAYDTEPSDEAFAALEQALLSQRRAALDLTRAERRLEEAEEAFRQAVLGERRIELEACKFALTADQRRALYDRSIAPVIESYPKLCDLVSELGCANVRVLEIWERARQLAKLVNDDTFLARHPRPSAEEAVSLLRLLIGAHTEGNAHEALTPWDRPNWDHPGLPVYEQAMSLLDGEEKRFS